MVESADPDQLVPSLRSVGTANETSLVWQHCKGRKNVIFVELHALSMVVRGSVANAAMVTPLCLPTAHGYKGIRKTVARAALASHPLRDASPAPSSTSSSCKVITFALFIFSGGEKIPSLHPLLYQPSQPDGSAGH